MILAIETSTPAASVALMDASSREIMWQGAFETDRSHNSKIFDPIREALELCNRQLSGVMVGIGPGSYSGVRVGIAVANGISLSLGVPAIGVSSLLAYDSENPQYYVVGDARRQSYFIAQIERGSAVPEPDLVDGDVFKRKLDKLEGKTIYSMDQSVVTQYPDQIKLGFPTAVQLVKQTSGEPFIESDTPIEPHYLRPPYITKAKKKPVPGFAEPKRKR